MSDLGFELIEIEHEYGSLVYIVGKDDLLNQLLAQVVSTQFMFPTSIITSVDAVPFAPNDRSEISCVLVDTRSIKTEELLFSLRSSSSTVLTSHRVGFMNLDRGTGIEERALKFGVKGFFYYDDSLETVLEGIRALMSGEVWVLHEILVQCAVSRASIARSTREPALTQREVDILLRVCVGKSNDEIAGELLISTNTVRTHLYHIYKKIDVSNKAQVIMWATEHLL
jgi:DNA-binding NarL/FixJ family response regulator